MPTSEPKALNFVLVAVVTAVVGAAAYYAFQASHAGSLAFWAIAGGPSIVLGLAGAARAWRDAELSHWLRPIWGDPTRGIMSAAVLVLISVGVVHLLAAAGTPREAWMARLYLQLGNPTTLREHIWLVALGVIVVAAAEEVLWRGLVTTLLAEIVGSRTAWLYAAALYGLSLAPTMWALRDPNAGLNPMLPLAGLGLGLAWGGIARMTGRLTPSIISHAAFDWCVIMLFRLWGPGV